MKEIIEQGSNRQLAIGKRVLNSNSRILFEKTFLRDGQQTTGNSVSASIFKYAHTAPLQFTFSIFIKGPTLFRLINNLNTLPKGSDLWQPNSLGLPLINELPIARCQLPVSERNAYIQFTSVVILKHAPPSPHSPTA